jgi:Imidazoleglycerol-phosphate synthase
MQTFYDAFNIGKADATLAENVFHIDEIKFPELKR